MTIQTDYSGTSEQIITLDLNLHVRKLSSFGFGLFTESIYFLHNRRLDGGRQHTNFNIALFKTVLRFTQLFLAFLHKGHYQLGEEKARNECYQYDLE